MKNVIPSFALGLSVQLALLGVTTSSHAEDQVTKNTRETKAIEVYDPIEPVNRGVFWFNEQFDQYLLGPVAHGYDYVMPNDGQVGVTNFFKNLRYPTYLISDLLQGKFEQALDHTGRFLINSTVGILGLIDVAEDVGLPDVEEDFGLAFASWGIDSGPYIMLPLLGPSNLRDTIGFVFDTLTNPTYWAFSSNDLHSDAQFYIPAGFTALKAVQTRNNLDDAITAGREGSLDYYLFMQSAYYQYREGQINRESGPAKEDATGIDNELDAILEKESKR